MREKRLVACLMTMALLGLGCESEEDRALTTLKSYHQALQAGEYDKAWALTSSDDQAALSKAAHQAKYTEGLGAIWGATLQSGAVTFDYGQITLSENQAKATVQLVETSPALEGPPRPREKTADLVREGDSWRVNTDWAEEQRRRERREEFQALESKIREADTAGRLPDAREQVDALQAVAREIDDDAAEVAAGYQTKLDAYPAGYWQIEKPEPDEVWLRLYESDPPDSILESASALVARCTGGMLSVYVAFEDVLSFGEDGQRAEVKWGEGAFERATMMPSNIYRGVFFEDAESARRQLEKHDGDTFTIKLNMVDGVRRMSFPLDGSTAALAQLGCDD